MGWLKGKVALVTGASSGIGRASAIALAREGAKVAVCDVDNKGGEETVKIIGGAGGMASFIKVDVSKATEVEAMVKTVVKTYGQLNCVHNNAGISPEAGGIVDLSEDVWDSVLDINLKGVWLCMKYEIPEMLKHGGGTIVNTSSSTGLVGVRSGTPAYTASKHGVVGLTKAAALQYAKEGIRVNAVCPGTIHTQLVDPYLKSMPGLEEKFVARLPIGRIGFPEEVAEAVVWLCSDKASFVTGHALAVDGGIVAE